MLHDEVEVTVHKVQKQKKTQKWQKDKDRATASKREVIGRMLTLWVQTQIKQVSSIRYAKACHRKKSLRQNVLLTHRQKTGGSTTLTGRGQQEMGTLGHWDNGSEAE